MISTSNVFHGVAHVTITGCLAATFFKQTVFDTTRQELYSAGDRLSVGAAVANFCLKTACLVLASHRTTKKILNGDFTLDDNPPPDIYTPAPSRIQRHKRFSIDSDMTFVADDDDYLKDFDTPPTPELPLATTDSSTTLISTVHFFNTNPPQPITIPPKPPDTVRIANRRKHQHSARLRAARSRTYLGRLQQLHDEILADKAALIDGWADAMAKLGLTSTLAPPD
ncbi:hypothetical protein DFJ58DRAFT_909793 [Suillus subalutaceus]|uniref:uncharacterized protein n=1 Tax=Suillus subalutaceus TaxID=48586 RepID=UPI001B8833DD|nr:uncharacterized protein DFJ58DRAFT_909793 [Suillus subalutaceus]KAG1876538.1 hypothetical protein DFJ58DRAFT_909793 [Suillus subalutaceus]